MSFRGLGTILALAALTGCSTMVNTGSGQAYVHEYQAAYVQSTGEAEAPPLDDAIELAANVEPLLQFPARIGIAKVGSEYFGVTLAAMPPGELAAWGELSMKLAPEFGEFVPVSPLVVEMAKQIGCDVDRCPVSLVEQIRIAAARQQLDAVLLYETATKTERYDNPLWLLHFTLIGYFMVPSEHADIDGAAHAMLLDVRNGYVYGFTSATVEDAVKAVSSADRIDERVTEGTIETEAAVTAALTANVAELLYDVRAELEARATPSVAVAP